MATHARYAARGSTEGEMMKLSLDLAHQWWTRAADPTGVARATVRLAARADAAGADLITVAEDPDGWDAFALLGAIATTTERATLAPGVTNPFLRHPNLIAASIATLDRLSGGRAALGLGRGQPEWYRDGLGLAVPQPLAALAETIAAVRAWSEPPHTVATPDAAAFPIGSWERTIGPVRARFPIYLAAAGPRALALAGRAADGVIFNNLTSDEALRRMIPRVRSAAAAAGRDPATLRFILRTHAVVTDDPAAWYSRQKGALAIINTLPGMAQLVELDGVDMAALINDLRRVMRTEEALRDAGGFGALRRFADFAAARRLISDDVMARLTIAGSLPGVRARLARLAAIGVTHVSLPPPESLVDLDQAALAEVVSTLGAS